MNKNVNVYAFILDLYIDIYGVYIYIYESHVIL